MTTLEKCQDVAKKMKELYNEDSKRRGYSLAETWWNRIRVIPRKTFIAIDIGTSGAWLVEQETGEIFNVHGYGRPDKNKKKTADMGNIFTVDPARMLGIR